MRTLTLSAAVAAIFSFGGYEAGWAGEPVNPNLSAEARQILSYLDSIYQKRVLAGYNVYVHTPDDYEQTGKQAAIWGRDIRWLGDVQEVARHAQESHPDLIVASGRGQALTGSGDPYLPFREILALLSGDVEARWQAGAISRDHADVTCASTSIRACSSPRWSRPRASWPRRAPCWSRRRATSHASGHWPR